MIACDSGSGDRGPIPLGSDTCASPLAWQIHDLESMLLGARRLGIPMIIGSAGGVAFALDEVLRASPAYRWTLNHTMTVDDPMELFPTYVDIVGG